MVISNTLRKVIFVLMILAILSLMIICDIFIKKIAFDTSSLSCYPEILQPSETTKLLTIKEQPTAPNITINSRCINLSSNDNFYAKIKVCINWFYICGLILFSIMLIIDYKKYKLSMGKYILYTILVNLVWLFLLVGGIFTSKFVFLAEKNVCNDTTYYCYDLNDYSLFFVKIYSILSFLISICVCIGCIYLYLQDSKIAFKHYHYYNNI